MLNGLFKRLQHHVAFSREKEKVETMLNESLNQFKFDFNSFQ